MLADKRHKGARSAVLFFETGGGFGYADKILILLICANRDHKTAAHVQLIHQRRRNIGPAGGDQDRVERGVDGPAVRAVGDAQGKVIDADAPQFLRRTFCQHFDAFDGVNLAHQTCQDRRLIAGAGAYFQNSLLTGQLKSSVIRATMNGCEIVCPAAIGRALSLYAWDCKAGGTKWCRGTVFIAARTFWSAI